VQKGRLLSRSGTVPGRDTDFDIFASALEALLAVTCSPVCPRL
jgi:hypothetical protein